jgi:enolase-phosphatase E1
MTKLYLFDIEGTTTDIKFVHKVLFPYSSDHMEAYILDHQRHPVVHKAILDTKKTVLEENGKKIDLNEVISTLKEWIIKDRKHPALKEVQGLIWDNGYSRGDFQGHVYDDVKPFFEKILSKAQVGIYSSGSVHAQKLIFGFSKFGDLTPMISYYFDTKVGGKRDQSSYERISQETEIAPKDIHFFSDIPEEITAAIAAGMEATQVVRDGTIKAFDKSVPDFNHVNLT